MKRSIMIKDIFIVIIIALTVIQLSIYIYKSILREENHTNIVEERSYETVKFSTINNELKEVENIEIENINYSLQGWQIEVLLNGDNNYIINSLKKINNMGKYTINKYNINGKAGLFTVKLDLYRKN